MKILVKEIKNSNIWTNNKKTNDLVTDVLIKDGRIATIEKDIHSEADIIIHEPDLNISPGWVDVFANFSEPGLEHRETITTGANAAAAGGYTTIFTIPNTQPTISTQSQVSYIVEKSASLPVQILPLGAISKNLEGKELAEMYDMQRSGAVAFTDGIHPVQNAALLLKALQYVKAFNGTLIQMPVDTSFSKLGLMNEGIISTQLGLPGIPAFAETLMIKKDIELLKYTESKLHITGVSSIESIELINEARRQGLQISCSIAPQYLLFCDEDLHTYDTNLKFNPPLRNHSNMLALREAFAEGKVDCVASHHLPQHSDDKVCEFEYAKNGMISLQTAFAMVNHTIPQLSTEKLIDLFSLNARRIFNLPQNDIEVGANAELTLFTRQSATTLTTENNKSKSINTPLFNQSLQGKVIATICKNQITFNN